VNQQRERRYGRSADELRANRKEDEDQWSVVSDGLEGSPDMPSHRQRSSGDRAAAVDDRARVTRTATEDAIRNRAYQLYRDRGEVDGRDWDDWFQAERELNSEGKSAS
jgi:hypothetical protein